MTRNMDAWRTWQGKIAVSSQYADKSALSPSPVRPVDNPAISSTPTSQMNNTQPQTYQSNTQTYNNTIDTNEKEIMDIDTKLNNVLTQKDQIKLIESNRIGDRRTVLQNKTNQNNAYRDLQSTEDELINRKTQLQLQITVAQDNLQRGGLDREAGEQFSAGISLEPVMDQDRVIPDVPIPPAMSASERAEFFGKEDTLLNPQYSMEDVAGGLTQQGASYLGGSSGANNIISDRSQFQQGMENQGLSVVGQKYTILDQAIASPVRDLQHSFKDPEEFQLAQDYGYTNMDIASSNIAKNPERFAGNLATAGALEVGLTVGTLGVGKVASSAWKAIQVANRLKSEQALVSTVSNNVQDVNNVEKLMTQIDMGKLPPVDKKIAKEVYDTEMAPFYKESGIPPSASKLPPAKSFFPQYTKKNNKKFTGIGISLAGATSLGSLTNKKKKGKSGNVFSFGNFKY